MIRKTILFFVIIFTLFSLSAQEDIRCLACHGKLGFKKVLSSGKILELFVDPTQIRLSAHKDHHCIDCHCDISEVPHTLIPQKVNCRRCHYLGNLAGAPQIEKYREYEESIHGKELAKGNTKAPVCQDCHGSHFILPGSDPQSTVAHNNIPRVCGSCHIDIFLEYQNSVHGKALAKGIKDAPVCTNCHGEHEIQKAIEKTSTISASNVAVTCAKCHASVAIMERYGIKTEQVKAYRESFHGIANEFGVLKAANCASCHTAHNILPESDPRSTVFLNNIPNTCGKCHPGANANFAKGRIHLNPRDKSAGAVYWVSLGFKVLTISTLAGLFLHIALDLFRRFKNKNNRMEKYE